ncbi:hypothetical protein [Aliamphritea spongicola]|uniref:spermine/spermidine synthase domain-containing protein n=1 Tax=Aliamphritea spongicola TaxID=707589 RepID=UPI00196BA98A|nr:hypothetical protein [Aliamphritea spongicola]MBN3563591.1 hypothetical protein [Aliamphritea spongicola]
MFLSREEFSHCFTDGTVIFDDIASSLRVLEKNNIRWLQLDDHYLQAAMDTGEPARPVFAYVQAMMMSLLLGNEPRSLLNLGIGGGAVERFVTKHLPGCEIVSVEFNAHVLAAAHQYFALPKNVKVIETDAFEYLQQSTERYDLICVDLFGSDRCQDRLQEESLWLNLYERMSATGCLTVNLLLTEQEVLLQVVTIIRQYFSHVVIFHMEDFENVVIYCRHQPCTAAAVLKSNADDLTECWGLDFKTLLNHLTYLPEPIR